MTRRRVIFTEPYSGKRYVTPEFNGDKEEFEQFGSKDSCTATWDEIMVYFNNVSNLQQFKAANYLAQGYYSSFGVPDMPPEPVVEIETDVPFPETISKCEKLYFLCNEERTDAHV